MLDKLILKLEERIQELESFVNQSAANHHALTGRYEEAKVILGFVHELNVPVPPAGDEVVPDAQA